MLDIQARRELRRSAAPHHTAALDHVVAVGDADQRLDILVDQQDRLAVRLQPREAVPDFARISGARPSVASSRISRRGLVISARPMASICCSPPES